jgi:antitoxin CptB
MNSLSKLKWRCRRGTLELDLLLTRYLESAYPQADEIEKQHFQKLLDLQDPEILSYLMGNRLPEPEWLAAIVTKIRALPAN